MALVRTYSHDIKEAKLEKMQKASQRLEACPGGGVHRFNICAESVDVCIIVPGTYSKPGRATINTAIRDCFEVRFQDVADEAFVARLVGWLAVHARRARELADCRITNRTFFALRYYTDCCVCTAGFFLAIFFVHARFSTATTRRRRHGHRGCTSIPLSGRMPQRYAYVAVLERAG